MHAALTYHAVKGYSWLKLLSIIHRAARIPTHLSCGYVYTQFANHTNTNYYSREHFIILLCMFCSQM